jgi:glutathione S-transferase
MSTYKLYYFNSRGRAELSRLIFAAAGQKYEDIRYEHEQWPVLEPETPLGQVPVLEFNGTKLPQSMSIARFLAKQFNLAGKDNFEQVKVDAVVDTIKDLIAAFGPTGHEQDKTKKQELTKKFFAEELPKHLKNLDVLGKLYGDGGPFFVSNNLTWADLYFYDIGEHLLRLDENGLDNNPWLKQNRAEVEKQPKIAEYLKNRPKTLS